VSATASPATATPRTPRWGRQASIIRPRQPAFWLLVGMLAIGGYIFVDEQAYFSELPTALTLSWALVLLYALPVFWLVSRVDLFEREPRLVLLAALLWGGVVATSLAGYANGAWLSVMSKVAPLDVTADWGPAVVGPGVEETLKLMGIVTLFLIVPEEFDGVMDGFVYGAMVGLGFTVVEDVSYFIHAAVAFGTATDQVGPVIDMFVIRVIAGGLYTHVIFTGIAGVGFAYFVKRTGPPRVKHWIALIGCVGVGVAAHVVWNSPWMQTILKLEPGATEPSAMQWIEYGTVKGLPFLLLLVVLVLFATKSEEKTFRAIVAGEPDEAVITEPEIKSLRSLLARRSARNAAAQLRGPAGARLTGQLQAAQVEYAMIRSSVDSLADPALEAQRKKIRALRKQLETVPLIPRPAPAPKPAPAAKPAPAPKPEQAARPAPAVQASVAAASKAGAPGAAAGAAAAAAGTTAGAAAGAAAGTAAGAAARTTAGAAAGPATAKAQPSGKRQAKAQAEPAGEARSEAAPPPPPPDAGWAPTHLVPPGGMAAWSAPDPSRQPIVNLPERLELVVEDRAGAWAHVRAINGWRGWVDGRRLIEKG
jgi:RsiW-degrading membrane proteinase PrsW (M82 family)